MKKKIWSETTNFFFSIFDKKMDFAIFWSKIYFNDLSQFFVIQDEYINKNQITTKNEMC